MNLIIPRPYVVVYETAQGMLLIMLLHKMLTIKRVKLTNLTNAIVRFYNNMLSYILSKERPYAYVIL